ncbi:unnamed protein product, partial [marine sediment metagenome]
TSAVSDVGRVGTGGSRGSDRNRHHKPCNPKRQAFSTARIVEDR